MARLTPSVPAVSNCCC